MQLNLHYALWFRCSTLSLSHMQVPWQRILFTPLLQSLFPSTDTHWQGKGDEDIPYCTVRFKPTSQGLNINTVGSMTLTSILDTAMNVSAVYRIPN